jgi:uncharacterized protein (TIGR00290 family)
MLHVLRAEGTEVVGLLTMFSQAADRVAMHAVRRTLVEAQSAATGIPVWPIQLPWPCSNAEYEHHLGAVVTRARENGVTHLAFGDLFLEEIREYRIRQLAGSGIEPLFPLWDSAADTPALAERMLAAGLRAVLTCVDPKQLAAEFAGRLYDRAFLDCLPRSVDPCGERGEFHTFCFAGPMFRADIPIRIGEVVCRDGFWFADVDRDDAPQSCPVPHIN